MAFPTKNSSRDNATANVLGALVRGTPPEPMKGGSPFAPRDGSGSKPAKMARSTRLNRLEAPGPDDADLAQTSTSVGMPGAQSQPGMMQVDGNQSPIPPRPTGELRAHKSQASKAPESGLEKAMGQMADKMHPVKRGKK